MKYFTFLIGLFVSAQCFSQVNRAEIPGHLRKGIIADEFIYETAPFPQCHASTIEETPNGIVTAWFGGTREGNNDVNIYVSRWVNNQWTAPAIAAEGKINEKTRYACYNPVLYQVPGGELILFYKIGPRVIDWTGWLVRSYDHGYTKDNGKTWEKGPDLNDAKPLTGIQPSILRHDASTLQSLCRSTNGTVNQTWSKDNGKTWSMLGQTSIPNPNSGIDAITLKDGRHLLVYNHVVPRKNEEDGWSDRSPLNVAISDDGVNWKQVLVLENEPKGEFSYPTVMQTSDGSIHITYTWKRKKIKHVVIKSI